VACNAKESITPAGVGTGLKHTIFELWHPDGMNAFLGFWIPAINLCPRGYAGMTVCRHIRIIR